MDRSTTFFQVLLVLVLIASCGEKQQEKQDNSQAEKEAMVKLITLDPGHFHASLIQKSMYDDIDPKVHVYAPDADDVDSHLDIIERFNTRAEDPTQWIEEVYRGDDYLEKMLNDKAGNVMMVAGNNGRKTEYIHAAVQAGLHVYADKPMVITPEEYPLLKDAFRIAEEKGLLIYDIMTERFEITSLLQKELAGFSDLFGDLISGTAEEPAISKESVHHFYKNVAGKPLKRPAWFFDIEQEGAGIVDVSTHLVDLIMWACYPEQAIPISDVELVKARQWATKLSPTQFEQVTKMSTYPEYLEKYLVDGDQLEVFSNGEIIFKVRGKHGKASVIWNFEAPAGAKDTHYSIMRGTKAQLIIRQDKPQNYQPTLYVEPVGTSTLSSLEGPLNSALEQLSSQYPGIQLSKEQDRLKVDIPEKYHIGHEAHFGQVTSQFLQYLRSGSLPEWEKQNMLTKYYITTEAYRTSK